MKVEDLASNIWAVNGILSIVKHNDTLLMGKHCRFHGQVSWGFHPKNLVTTWDPTLKREELRQIQTAIFYRVSLGEDEWDIVGTCNLPYVQTGDHTMTVDKRG